MFVVINKDNQHEFWSNEFGWTDFEEADYFTEDEKQDYNAPLGGEWISLWQANCLQFARLIAEAEAAGVWRMVEDTPVWNEMLESMDLEDRDIFEIVERAQRVFEISKNKLPGHPNRDTRTVDGTELDGSQ